MQAIRRRLVLFPKGGLAPVAVPGVALPGHVAVKNWLVPELVSPKTGWGLLPGALVLTRTGLSPARRTRLSGRTMVGMIPGGGTVGYLTACTVLLAYLALIERLNLTNVSNVSLFGVRPNGS
jgi:hypothetical protein